MTRLAVLVLSALGGQSAAALLRAGHKSEQAALDTYSFEQFQRDFGRAYAPNSEEHSRRLALFQAAVAEIKATNIRNAKEGRSWKAGLHPFMDWSHDERRKLNGYKPSRRSVGVSFIHSGAHAHSHARSNSSRFMDSDLDGMTSGGLGPESGPPMRNQGDCGSCWAISAAEALEAQLQKSGADPSLKVSAQALVDCVPNPQHCGGSGGCDGATGELAYAFVRDYGIPLEKDHKYHAKTQQCPETPLSGPYPAKSRVRVSGWTALPSNQAKPLMQALVNQGPTVVAVDGNNWFNYESGVFDGCDKDATLGHAVLAKGFGTDESSGKQFWLIQNSWGSEWGENGHIRLLKRDDDDNYCGTDKSPKEGVGCDGGPSEVTVCGTCGVLYDSLVPEGVHIENDDSAQPPAEEAAAPDAATSASELLMQMH